MLISPQDLGSHVASYDANASASSGAPVLILAAGTGDNVKIVGVTVDRYVSGALADSAAIVTGYLTALTAAKTLSLAHEVQYSADGSSWDTAVVLEAAAVKATGAGNKRGQVEFSLSLRSQKRYLRINVTPDLSNTATDTATFHTVAVLGGFEQLPQ